MWTLIVSVIYAVMLFIAAALISSSVGLNPFSNSNPLTVPFCITQAVLAFTAMLYPLSGFLADVWCGRFKAVMIGLTLLYYCINCHYCLATIQYGTHSQIVSALQ